MSDPTPATDEGLERLPDVMDEDGLREAYEAALDMSLLLARVETITTFVHPDGSEEVVESVVVEEVSNGSVRVGHASFDGGMTIRQARAAGNDDLADILLSAGVDYVAERDLVHFPRAVGVALDVGIPAEGTDWVFVDRSRLDDTGRFALDLIAPSRATQLTFELGASDGFEGRRVDDVEGLAVYVDDTDDEEQLSVEVDGEGRLRGLSGRAPFIGRDGRARLRLTFDPHDGRGPAPLDPGDSVDVTAEFGVYVDARNAEAPSTLGN